MRAGTFLIPSFCCVGVYLNPRSGPLLPSSLTLVAPFPVAAVCQTLLLRAFYNLTSFFFKTFFSVSSCLLLTQAQFLVFWFVEAVGQTIFATIMSVKGAGPKNSSTTCIGGALPTKAAGFAVLILKSYSVSFLVCAYSPWQCCKPSSSSS